MKKIAKLAAFTAPIVLCVLLAPRASLADEPGVWQKQQYTFAFMGFTSTYSCDGLADKLKRLLLAAGARKDAKATAGACAASFGHPDKFARADLVFYTLTPLAKADKSAAAAPIDGAWRPVSLSDRSPRELAVGDCELVQQFRDNVLPLFTTRAIDDGTACIPHQNSGSIIKLKFETFTAARTAAPPK